MAQGPILLSECSQKPHKNTAPLIIHPPKTWRKPSKINKITPKITLCSWRKITVVLAYAISFLLAEVLIDTVSMLFWHSRPWIWIQRLFPWHKDPCILRSALLMWLIVKGKSEVGGKNVPLNINVNFKFCCQCRERLVLSTMTAQASLCVQIKTQVGKSRFMLHYCMGEPALRGVIVWAVMCVLHTKSRDAHTNIHTTQVTHRCTASCWSAA